MERMDILATRNDEKSGKTYYTKIGAAFPTKNGGWSLKFDALPVNGQAVMFPPKPKAEARGELDDTVPF